VTPIVYMSDAEITPTLDRASLGQSASHQFFITEQS
jgi:hypothetical protein